MRLSSTKVLISCIFIGMGYFGFGQVKEVTEAEVTFDILKWHFNAYPNSVSNSWKIVNDGEYYEADFTFEGKEYVVNYSAAGKMLKEIVDLNKDVPVSLVHQLEDTYEKFRVTSFIKIKDFTNKTTFYELQIKSKERGDETLNFDENYIPVDFNLLSKAN